MEIVSSVTNAMDQIRDARSVVASVNKFLDVKNKVNHKELQSSGKAMTDSLKVLQELILNKEGLQGIVRSPDILSAKINSINRYLYNNLTGPNSSHEFLMKFSENETKIVLERINQFFLKDWPNYRSAVEKEELSMFKNYRPIRID